MGRYGWPNEDGVRGTKGETIRVTVACRECDYGRTMGSPGALRVSARRHAALSKHTVAVVATVRRLFVPEGRKA